MEKFKLESSINKEEIITQDESMLSEAMLIAKENSKWENKGFKQRISWVARKLMMLVATYATLSVGIESGKRIYAYNELDKIKESLGKYKIEYFALHKDDRENYSKKYEQAKELFGEDNLEFLTNPNYFEMKDSSNLESRSESIKYLEKDFTNISDGIEMSFLVQRFPEYFFRNIYEDEVKDEQHRIEKLKSSINNEEVWHNKNDVNIISENNTVLIINENLPGIEDTLNPKVLNEILNKTYPKGWFNDEVSEIVLKKERIFSSDASHIKRYGAPTEEMGHFERNNNGNTRIVVANAGNRFKYNNYPGSYVLFDLLGHEGAHANDWESNFHLTSTERLNFLMSIYNRIYSKDRWISSYVEWIKPKTKQDENMSKCTEYWAEICGEYFTHGAKNLSPKDVDIIEKIIKKKDDNFNINEALITRDSILKAEVYNSSHDKLTELAHKIAALGNEHDKILNQLLNEFNSQKYDELFGKFETNRNKAAKLLKEYSSLSNISKSEDIGIYDF